MWQALFSLAGRTRVRHSNRTSQIDRFKKVWRGRRLQQKSLFTLSEDAVLLFKKTKAKQNTESEASKSLQNAPLKATSLLVEA